MHSRQYMVSASQIKMSADLQIAFTDSCFINKFGEITWEERYFSVLNTKT